MYHSFRTEFAFRERESKDTTLSEHFPNSQFHTSRIHNRLSNKGTNPIRQLCRKLTYLNCQRLLILDCIEKINKIKTCYNFTTWCLYILGILEFQQLLTSLEVFCSIHTTLLDHRHLRSTIDIQGRIILDANNTQGKELLRRRSSDYAIRPLWKRLILHVTLPTDITTCLQYTHLLTYYLPA